MYSNLRRSLVKHWKLSRFAVKHVDLVELRCLELAKLRAEELESHVPWSTAPSQGREIFGYGLWPPETRCLTEGTCWAPSKSNHEGQIL